MDPEASNRTEYARGDGRSLPALMSDLIRDAVQLLQREIELAKAEIGAAVSQATGAAIALVVGGVIAHTGLLALVAALILALALVWPAWLAALVVGAVIVAIGGVMALTALQKLKHLQAPNRTIKSLQEDVEILREKFQ